ncbi:MAG: YhdH/YhfP family quinone oxidoreductase [Bacteroidales bacterium]|jgi:putative YhdH/YhfP family quinone oxidoreductase|nr:YhdH/YhfP family quinone oxidoreductase [Bacteroidales bacterium]
MSNEFRALRVTEKDGEYIRDIKTLNISDLPEGDLLIYVEYSSLNYKDALSCSGNKGVTRNYPHTPGIDAVGIVKETNSNKFIVGDKVIVTGFDLGMNTDGGLAEYIRVPESWAVKLPENMSTRQAMIIGTAGLTAALCINKLLIAGQKPEMGDIVVTGALGGVGSVAIAILNKIGFKTIAATTDLNDGEDILKIIGADRRVDKTVTNDNSGKVMLKPQWAGAVDVVGGNTLATIIKGCAPNGSISCCGNIGSGDLTTSVYPFILRGVNLLGIDSQNCKSEIRTEVWNRIADEWYPESIEQFVTETTLDNVDEYITLMQNKKSRGRVIVKIQ